MENPDFSALPSLIKHLTENSTEDQTIPKFNLNISLSNLSIPFEMMVPHQDNTTIRNYPNLSDFLVDLKTNLSGESEISGWCFWAMIFLYIIVASMGLIGNGLVLGAIVSRKKMRTAHNSFIGTLATSDFLLCLITLPVNLWEMLFQKWPFGQDTETLCSFMMAVKKFPIFFSSLAIIGIGWDRYRSVITPERGELTLRTTFVWIAGMILLSCTESAPLFFMAQISPLVSFQEEVQMQNILICREVWTKGSRVAYKTFSCVFQFIIPLFFVVYFNFAVIKKLRNRPPSQHEEQNQRRKKCLRLILAVTIIFFSLWLPLTIFTLISEYNPQSLKNMMGRYHEVTYGILHLLGAGTSIANPILYGYMNENFRNEYRKFYHRMPWYKSSLLLAARWRSVKSSKTCPRSDSESSLESCQPISKPPKRLRKLKDVTMSQLESHNSHSGVIHRDIGHIADCHSYENKLSEIECDNSHDNCDRPASIESNYGSLESNCDRSHKCHRCHSCFNAFIKVENEKAKMVFQRSKSLKEHQPKNAVTTVRKTTSFELSQDKAQQCHNNNFTILPEDHGHNLPILENGTPKSIVFRILKPSNKIPTPPNQLSHKLSEFVTDVTLSTLSTDFFKKRTISLQNPLSSRHQTQHVRFYIKEKSHSEETAL